MDALVSVIIPVYNVSPYLREALDSVIHQSYKNLEILVIDDGSTDGTNVLCDEIAKKDKRIMIIHKQNGGVAETRNVARDDSASRLGYTGDEASVSGRKAIARANATRKRDLELEKRSRDHEFATREKAHKDAQAAQQKNIDQMGKRKIS